MEANARLITAAPETAAERDRLKEINSELLQALTILLKRDKKNTCTHSETRRAGFIWEVCDNCGMKWSDDRSPKPEFVEPIEWIKARAAIAKALEANTTIAKTQL